LPFWFGNGSRAALEGASREQGAQQGSTEGALREQGGAPREQGGAPGEQGGARGSRREQ